MAPSVEGGGKQDRPTEAWQTTRRGTDTLTRFRLGSSRRCREPRERSRSCRTSPIRAEFSAPNSPAYPVSPDGSRRPTKVRRLQRPPNAEESDSDSTSNADRSIGSS